MQRSTHPIPIIVAKLELENCSMYVYDDCGTKKCSEHAISGGVVTQDVAKLKFNGTVFKDIVLTTSVGGFNKIYH